jgi:hypothetical protein
VRKLLFLIVLFSPRLSAQDPLEIIRHYFDTVSTGDISKWNNIQSVYMESQSSISMDNFHTKSTKFSGQKINVQKLYRVWPDKSRIDTYVDSTLTSSLYNLGDNNFFVFGNMAPVPVSAGPYEPYFEFEPVIVKHVIDKKRKITLLGIKDMFGSNCFDIEVTTKGLTWHFYFNTKTYLLEYWSNSTATTEAASLTKVSDYKKYGDFLIATSETKRTTGGDFFWSIRKKIAINAPIDPMMFHYERK